MSKNAKTYLAMTMRCLLFVSAFALCGTLARKDLADISHWWSIIASVLNVVTIVILLLICRRNHTTYREMLRLGKDRGKLSKGLLFVLLMLLVGMAGMYAAGWLCYGEFPYLAPMMIAPVPPVLAVINLFVLPVTTTLAEDGLYLGYGVNGFSSKWTAILLPAFFYALQHSFIPTIFDARFMAYRFLSFLPLTLWICYRYYNRENILYIMAGHCVLNIATAAQIVMSSFMPDTYFALIK